MAGRNTQTGIENALHRHAKDGRIKAWRKAPHQPWSRAPKWLIDLNPGTPLLPGVQVGDPDTLTVPLTTYQEAKLFCAALASAERAARVELGEYRAALREVLGLDPGQDPTEALDDAGLPLDLLPIGEADHDD